MRCISLCTTLGRGAMLPPTHIMPVDLQVVGEVNVIATPEGRYFLASQLAECLKKSPNTIDNWCGNSVIVSRDSGVLRALK